jgi:hypothetical protein
LLGACVSQETGDKFCGVAAQFNAGGCTPKACAADQSVNVDTGACLPKSAVDAISRLKLEEDEHVGCHSSGRVLVVAHDSALCMSPTDVCGRGSRQPANLACGGPAACEAGEILDESSDRCIRIVKSDEHGYVVDVGAWMRFVLGPDGGPGTRTLCSPLLSSGVQPLVYGRVDVRIDLAFPDNDVSLVSPNVTLHEDDTRQVPQPQANALVMQLVETLRQLGGTASAGVVSTHVVCDLPALESTMAIRAGDSGLR